MKYFFDTEFIEGFHKPVFGKRRHFIDLISIGIVAEDGREYYAISNEFNPKDADQWVRDNVISKLPLKLTNRESVGAFYERTRNVSEDAVWLDGKRTKQIALDILEFTGCKKDYFGKYYYGKSAPFTWQAPEGIEFYAYYADYDWVLFCSLFGRMIDLPKGFPMYCRDLKQMLDDKAEIYREKNTPFENIQLQAAYDKAGGIFSTMKMKSLKESLEIIKNEPLYPRQENEHDALADARWNRNLYHFLTTKL